MYINRIQNLLSKETRLITVETLALSHINYGINIWSTANITRLKRVQKLQNFPTKVDTSGASKFDHATPLLIPPYRAHWRCGGASGPGDGVRCPRVADWPPWDLEPLPLVRRILPDSFSYSFRFPAFLPLLPLLLFPCPGESRRGVAGRAKGGLTKPVVVVVVCSAPEHGRICVAVAGLGFNLDELLPRGRDCLRGAAVGCRGPCHWCGTPGFLAG